MKRVLIITYYWPPSGGAGVQRVLKFVKYLPEFGISPVVLTVDPSQASYPRLDSSLEADIPESVRVVRTSSSEPLRMLMAIAGRKAVPHAGFADNAKPGLLQRAMRWVRGNLLIPDARRGWVRHAVQAAECIIRAEQIDAVLISSPPHSAQLIGLELKKRWPGLRIVADMRDPWTDIFYVNELFEGKRAKRRNAAWEAQVVKQADAITVVGPSMKQALAQRYGAEVNAKTSVITNGFDEEDLERIGKIPLTAERFRITYVGTMAGSYAPGVLFEAVLKVLAANPAIALELRFVGGEFPEVRKMAEAAGLGGRCTWEGQVPHDEALREMAAAQMLLLVIPQGIGDERILTGKLFEYIGVGRPILGIGPAHGDAAAVIESCSAGRMFGRGEAAAMAEWITKQAREGGTRSNAGQEGHRAQYARRMLAGRMAAILVPGLETAGNQ